MSCIVYKYTSVWPDNAMNSLRERVQLSEDISVTLGSNTLNAFQESEVGAEKNEKAVYVLLNHES